MTLNIFGTGAFCCGTGSDLKYIKTSLNLSNAIKLTNKFQKKEKSP